MNCTQALPLLDAYVDNELDVRSVLELEEHLSGCPACSAQERAARELQAAARRHLTRHAPPEALAASLRSAQRPRRGFALAALLPMAALALAVAFWPRPAARSVEDALVAAHVRSMLASHLTDVASSDQHTVKPWFQGKLDFSLAVSDFAAQGFPLVGGRLDYLDDAPAAALVYRRGQHVINLFAWPSAATPSGFDRRGYRAVGWQSGGIAYVAISDVNDADLRAFVALARRE